VGADRKRELESFLSAMRRARNPVQTAVWWVKKQPPKVKTALAVLTGIVVLVFLRFVIRDHDNLFVAAEFIHAVGIGCLVYKLWKEKTCAGESLLLSHFYLL
jgi:ER lumen protein retaining receptor